MLSVLLFKSRAAHSRGCSLRQMAMTDAGLHVAASSRWTDKTDGKMVVQWEADTIFIHATVYWLSI